MQFVLVGFSQTGNVRRFVFERVTAERARIQYSVDADLLALRGFRISMQELPLICRRLLETVAESDPMRALILTEEHMRQHAAVTTAALEQAALKRKSPFNGRRPGQPSNFGQMRTSAAATAGAPPVRIFPVNTKN